MKLTPEIRKALRRKRRPGRVVVKGADDKRIVNVVMFKRRMQWRVVQDVALIAEKRK